MMTVTYAVGWFPQEYAAPFFGAKGFIALVATLLYLAHMSRAWSRLRSRAQRWRYLALFYLTVLLAISTVEQVHDGALVAWRNLAAFGGAVVVLVAAVVSLRED